MSNQYDVCKKILISKMEIDERVAQLGKQISQDYCGKEIIFVSILNGSFMFTSDLVKHINLDCLIDFMQVSTYGDETVSSGTLIIKKDLSFDISGKHVIILEDIIDSGYTLYKLTEYLQKKSPASLKIATFIDKPARREYEIKSDYVAFELNDDYFIVGYGLDFSQKYRNLPYIGVLDEHIYE